SLPGLREALGLDESGSESRERVDAVEERARELLIALQAADWSPDAVDGLVERFAGQLFGDQGGDRESVGAVLRFAATEVVPRLRGTNIEIERVLHALNGG